MTTLHDAAIVDMTVPDPVPPARLIAVGVRDRDHDETSLKWSLSQARPGRDVVHVVHAYLPLRLDGCVWEPVVRERDARALASQHVVAQAAQRVRAASPEQHVEGSAIAGLPEDVLQELSSIVDLIVIGDDSTGPVRTRKIAWRIQDTARCAVACVPPGYTDSPAGQPITVVVDDHGLCDAAMRFATAEALRWQVTLRVSRTWASLHEGDIAAPGWLAEQQEELDAQLAAWRERFAHLAVSARIELAPDWLAGLQASSALVVAGQCAAAAVRTVGWVEGRRCPTVVVPD